MAVPRVEGEATLLRPDGVSRHEDLIGGEEVYIASGAPSLPCATYTLSDSQTDRVNSLLSISVSFQRRQSCVNATVA